MKREDIKTNLKQKKAKKARVKLSIRKKILIPTTLLVIAICASMGIYAYTCIHDGMVDMGVEEAGMAAQIVVDILDAGISINTHRSTNRNNQQSCGNQYLLTDTKF